MRTKTDFYKERGVSVKPFFEDYLGYAKKIKNAYSKALGQVEVYVFGSVLTKEHSLYHSDIDVLVVSPKIPHTATGRAALKRKIFGALGFLEPFEIHLATPQEYDNWYRHLIKKKLKV